MAKFKLWLSTDKVGSRCEYEITIGDGELEEMTDDELEEYMLQKLHEKLNWSYEKVS
jgi:hypothetical protein